MRHWSKFCNSNRQTFINLNILQICRNGCDEPICEGTPLIEGPKKPKTTTTRARIAPTTRPVDSPLSRATTARNILRTRPPTKAPRIDETEVPETRQPVSRTRPPLSRGSRPPVTVPVEVVTRSRTRAPNTRVERPIVSTEIPRIRGRPTTQPPTYLPPETTTEFSCDNPGSENNPQCRPNCALNPNDRRCPTPPPTTQRPRRIETTTFACTPGSQDPRCAPDCYPGNRDPRCPAPTLGPIIVAPTRWNDFNYLVLIRN